MATFEQAATDSDLSMRERASKMRAAGRQAESDEFAAASREAADRADDFASSIEASQRLVQRREDSFAADMAESFFRGTSGDLFGKPREVIQEAAAMDRRVEAAQERYIAGIDDVIEVVDREGLEVASEAVASKESGLAALVGYAYWAVLIYVGFIAVQRHSKRSRRRAARGSKSAAVG